MSSRNLRLALLTGALVGGIACAAATPPAAEKKSDADVVARVGDKSFSLDEVDRKAMAAGVGPYQALYEARSRALDEMIAEYLLDKEATSRGISRDELIQQEITQKVQPVQDADVEAFFNQNQARMGGRTLEQIQDQIRAYLQNENAGAAMESYLGQLKQKANVRVTLDPPRVEVEVAANNAAKGPAGAAVTIVEFSDFQ